jgi:hypothetical protein
VTAKRNQGLCILSFAMGILALPTGLIALVHEGSLAGIILSLAGMALLVQSLEFFFEK